MGVASGHFEILIFNAKDYLERDEDYGCCNRSMMW
jgi:hypothetical protein